MNPSRPQKTLTHCGRRPWVPGCLRTLSSRCGSFPGSSSVLGAGTSGPEGVRWGHPEAADYPGSYPPGRGSCGCAGHQLEGKCHSQGCIACRNRATHAVPALFWAGHWVLSTDTALALLTHSPTGNLHLSSPGARQDSTVVYRWVSRPLSCGLCRHKLGSHPSPLHPIELPRAPLGECPPKAQAEVMG